MRFTRAERLKVMAGELVSVLRLEQPDVKRGDTVVVAHSKPTAYHDEQSNTVFRAPKEPSLWITVTSITRHRKGGYIVRFDITDTREPAYLLASGGEYTTNAARAVDTVEVVLSSKERRKLSVEARARTAERKVKDDEEDVRRQVRAAKSMLTEALAGLDWQARAVLLAKIDRDIREAQDAEREAA